MPVPLFSHRDSIEPLMPEIKRRVAAVLDSGRYILGPEVEAFEDEFAAYVGRSHCVGVANGTEALTIALRVMGVERGAEVVVPAISFFATVEAVVNAGARPVFADIDPETWCMSAATVEPVLSAETGAVLPVHLFGNPAPVDELRELVRRPSGPPIPVLEDAAQAVGAKLGGRMVGALGDAAAFSFYPSKNLGCFGDGGAIVTDDDEVAAACRRLRNHGSADKRLHTEAGYNSRLDELQAAALRVLLPELGGWTEGRREAVAAYRELGIGELVASQREVAGAESCYHLYVVSTPSRDRLAEELTRREIGNRVYYDPPLHRQHALARFAPTDALPGADRFAAECLALPIGPELERDQIATVVDAVRASLA